jgi:hypothetical protein
LLKFDDQFPIHRKVGALSDAAFRLHVEAIFWCARNLTDGFIAQDEIDTVSRYRRPERYVAECMERDAWHRVEDGLLAVDCEDCRESGTTLRGAGWLIHGFLDWQQSRSKVLQIREARKKAGHNGGVRSGMARTKGKPAGHDPPEPKPKQVGSRRLEANANPRAPSPPLRGGSAGVAGGGSKLAAHGFEEGPDPKWCKHCELPRINKVHLSSSKRP